MTAEQARALFHYDPSTGFLYWKESGKGRRADRRAGCLPSKRDGYSRTTYAGEQYLAHRLIWLVVYGAWPADQVDHINGDRGDNRLANLRGATNTTNAQNLHRANKNNRTGLLGTSVDSLTGKYRASISAEGKTIYLGLYLTPEEAHSAYKQAKRLIHAGCTI